MNHNVVEFGDPEKFLARISWTEDVEPMARRPIPHGWSMGRLELLAGGVSLTAHSVGGEHRDEVEWYLGPVLNWLARNWIDLFHEERFSWDRPSWESPSLGPAAAACEQGLRYWSLKEDAHFKRNAAAVQDWYRRHCLSVAAEGGLLPDLYLRRFMDQIEISWSGAAPLFAPRGFAFHAEAGVARLDVADVAKPLWEMLLWAANNPPPLPQEAFKRDWEELCAQIHQVRHQPSEAFVVNVAADLLARVRRSFAEGRRSDLVDLAVNADAPWLVTSPVAVAMYGGLEPDLSDQDVYALRDLLLAQVGGEDPEPLLTFADLGEEVSVGMQPHEDGYFLADAVFEQLAEDGLDITAQGFVDVEQLCALLEINVGDRAFDSQRIRGVALAGEGYGPAIVVNENSPFNANAVGRRFTLAHELCHILFDRNSARSIGHTSGPWAPLSVERKANAFAAYLLMPRDLIHDRAGDVDFQTISREQVHEIASRLRVGVTALREHLYNIGLIDEVRREALRVTY